MAKRCRGCIHWRRLCSSNSSDCACHYSIDTGKLRGCEPEDCTYYDSDRRKLRKIRTGLKEKDLAVAFSKLGEKKGIAWWEA